MSAAEILEEPFWALAELGEHLTRARAALPPLGADDKNAPGDPPLLHVLDVAQAAVASLEDFAGGLRRSFAGGATISLTRDGQRVTVTVIGSPTADDFAAFKKELADLDQRLLNAASLLGVLLHLCAGWAAVGFAPPILLQTLAASGADILKLGAAIDSRIPKPIGLSLHMA